ncbi:hypothetical protein LCGC14_0889250 [marine sediment metagenome]|uniref:Nucleoid-associated protein n=1 Tax=marine sediment metagenome TaxID=412755 RepID=A0A0F9RJ04_9ZZZZ|nr:YbaB/EbfC family nucleoid-associated protein [Actinomycetota bacterium]
MFNPKMMKQMQQMQRQMAQIEEELKGEKVDATAGGGMVKATVSGKQDILEIKINPEAVDPQDVELLEDMVTAAVREAIEKSRELAQQKMGGLTGGMNIPGLM